MDAAEGDEEKAKKMMWLVVISFFTDHAIRFYF